MGARCARQALRVHATLTTPTTGVSLFGEQAIASPRMMVNRAGGRAPSKADSQTYLEYRRVLRDVMSNIGTELGISLTESDQGCLADTLPDWPVFPEVVGALNVLRERYSLAVISNVDDDLFSRTADGLNVDFDSVVTSQQVQSYKPNPRNFEVASERMAVARGRWIHVAESLYHDIGPANRLGITSVWVDRPDRGGATRPSDALPDLIVPDVASLVQMMYTA